MRDYETSFEHETVKKEDFDDFSVPNMNLMCNLVINDDNRTTKNDIREKGSNDVSKNVEINRYSLSLTTRGVKKDETEKNEDAKMEQMQLKPEEVEINDDNE